MNVHIYTDELYPVFILDKLPSSYEKEVEISDELYARYLKVEKAFEEMQEELENIYRNKPK